MCLLFRLRRREWRRLARRLIHAGCVSSSPSHDCAKASTGRTMHVCTALTRVRLTLMTLPQLERAPERASRWSTLAQSGVRLALSVRADLDLIGLAANHGCQDRRPAGLRFARRKHLPLSLPRHHHRRRQRQRHRHRRRFLSIIPHIPFRTSRSPWRRAPCSKPAGRVPRV